METLTAPSPSFAPAYCMNLKALKSKPYNSDSARILHFPFRISFPSATWKPRQELKCSSSRGMAPLRLSAASSSFLNGSRTALPHTRPKLCGQNQSFKPLRAFMDIPYSFRITEKPRWWWRTLSCLPYLMPLHEITVFANIAYPPHPLLERFEALAYPFLLVTGRLPRWFKMVYFTGLYLGVVRRNECPPFLKFHLVMGMLLDNLLEIIPIVCSWVPVTWFCNNVGVHFCLALAIAYLLLVLECMRCALAGTYADVPVFDKAAFFHMSR